MQAKTKWIIGLLVLIILITITFNMVGNNSSDSSTDSKIDSQLTAEEQNVLGSDILSEEDDIELGSLIDE